MAIIKCKMCGGDIELSVDKTFGTCEFCGSTMTLPKVDSDQRAAAFNRGNHFRRNGDFDKALGIYEHIVQEDDTDAEAHWCCVLCRFGIEYVEDPTTYEWMPTCHRASFDSVLEDVDYLAALEHSDGVTRRQYQKDAAKIAEVQKGVLATSQNADPYDVFICYKENDESGARTIDSTLAQEIYYQLTEQGRRVFFARISLEEIAGTQYEPYIFSALHSAKVMVVVATKAEYANAVWVKNEWSRFLTMMRKDRTKLLLPCYRDMDPYDLPEQLSVLQSYDMSKIGFMQDLTRGIAKVLDAYKAESNKTKEPIIVQSAGNAKPDALLKRGNMALEDSAWDKATTYFDQVLNMDAENGAAFWGLFLAREQAQTADRFVYREVEKAESASGCTVDSGLPDFHMAMNTLAEKYGVPGFLTVEDIAAAIKETEQGKRFAAFVPTYCARSAGYKKYVAEEKSRIAQDSNFNRAARFGGDDLKKTLNESLAQIISKLESKEVSAAKEESSKIAELKTEHAVFLAAAEEIAKSLHRQAKEQRAQEYVSVCAEQEKARTLADYDALVVAYKRLGGYKDAKERLGVCSEKVAMLQAAIARATEKKKITRKKIIITGIVLVAILAIVAGLTVILYVIPSQDYAKAKTLLDSGDYDAAADAFKALGDFSDSKEQADHVWYVRAEDLLADGYYEEAATAFSDLGDYADSKARIGEVWYTKAETLATENDISAAAIEFGIAQNAGYRDAGDRAKELWDVIADRKTIAVGAQHSLAIKLDGTALACGSNTDGRCDVSEWNNLVAVAAGLSHSVGLKSDGTVVATGDNTYGQCDVDDWNNIVAVSAVASRTVGLRADGTIVISGKGEDTSHRYLSVAVTNHGIIGLQADGAVFITGENAYTGLTDLSAWKDIGAVSAGERHVVGLKKTGIVIASGTGYSEGFDNVAYNALIKNWRGIVQTAAGGDTTVGIKSDGTVVAASFNQGNECDVGGWNDIVEVVTSGNHTLGLKADGTLVSTGENGNGQCDVSGWNEIRLPNGKK